MAQEFERESLAELQEALEDFNEEIAAVESMIQDLKDVLRHTPEMRKQKHLISYPDDPNEVLKKIESYSCFLVRAGRERDRIDNLISAKQRQEQGN
jgi:hypothetical protein